MKIRLSIFAVTLTISSMGSIAAVPENLRTDGLKNPVTIDSEAPRFSWNLSVDDHRGTTQTSYHIKVNDPSGKPVWDSGIIASPECFDIAYQGEALRPLTRYTWSVTTVDSNGDENKSTENAWFETGLMDTGWNGARWITPATGSQTERNDITHYSIEADIEISNLSAGIFFGATDRSNYFMWQFNLEDGYPRFRPHHWTNGAAACDAEIDMRNIKSFALNQPFHVLIDVNGNEAKTYIDGTLIDTRTNPSGGNYLFGETGIRQDFALWNSSNPEKAYFDNFTVKDLTDGKSDILASYDFEDNVNPFDSGTITNGRLFVSGSYAWPRKTVEGSATAYDLELDMRIINDSAGILFSADSDDDTHMWSVIIKGSTPVLRRHIRTGGNWQSSDVSLAKYTTCTSLRNDNHHLRIAVRPGKVETYLDNTLVDTYSDTSGTLHYGKTGFRTFHDGANNEIVLYDNVSLKVYDTSDATDEGSIVLQEDFEGDGHCYPDGTISIVDGNKMLRLCSTYDETCIFANLGSEGMPVIRRVFTPKGAVARAQISASALGVFDLRVNGARVGRISDDGNTVYDELKPGWTDYRSSVNYYSYDITPLLREGENVVGAELSNGWWAGAIAHGVYGKNTLLSFLARIDITYTDGSSETIVTDENWHTAACGPLVYGDIYNGEIYDARRDYSWSTPGFDASDWTPATVNTAINPAVVAPGAPSVTIRPHLGRKPQSINIYTTTSGSGSTYGSIDVDRVLTGGESFKLSSGETAICDFGQNLVGHVRIVVKAPRGTKIRLRFGEMLNDSGSKDRANDGPAGSLYTYNLRTAGATASYTASGAPDGEEYAPTSSFFGFRYCEITASSDIELISVTAEVVGSDIEEYGLLTTSHKDVNQLISNIRWGQRGNFLSIPTDCPQRDERLGWTGDTQIFSRAASYASDTRAFYHKWMDQMRRGQRADGAYPDIAPFCNFWGYGNAAWGDAGVIVPWTVYTMTGDKLILEENYDANRKYMQFLANQADGNYKYNGAGTSFGDWLAYEELDPRYVSVAYYAYVATLMGHTANALGRTDEAEEYYRLHDAIAAEFRDRYVRDGKLTMQSQTALLLSLAFDLLGDDTLRTDVATTLRNKFETNGYKLQTGFVGTGILNPTLSAAGMDDIAYNLLLQRDNPSWLYSVDQGATTIWERWDSYTLDGGFNKHPWIMNSFNHYAYGVIYEWMMRYMAGIEYDADAPGFRHIVLQPRPDLRNKLPEGQERITHVAASTRTPLGTVASSWENCGNDQFIYTFTVPTGATATLFLPITDAGAVITESGKALSEVEGAEYKGNSDGKAVIELKSGNFRFEVRKSSSTDLLHSAPLSIRPNPFHDRLSLDGIQGDGRMTIVNSNGTVFFTGDFVSEVATASWPQGLYVISVTDNNTIYRTKAIKH